MTITAKILAQSVWPGSPSVITTMGLRYPRFVHPEFLTHRDFSRGASSSRAIPIARMIADVEADIAMPVAWGKNQPGMQARELLSPEDAAQARQVWLEAAEEAVWQAKRLDALGAHTSRSSIACLSLSAISRGWSRPPPGTISSLCAATRTQTPPCRPWRTRCGRPCRPARRAP